jgi:hypothetical protein
MVPHSGTHKLLITDWAGGTILPDRVRRLWNFGVAENSSTSTTSDPVIADNSTDTCLSNGLMPTGAFSCFPLSGLVPADTNPCLTLGGSEPYALLSNSCLAVTRGSAETCRVEPLAPA